MFGAQIAGRAPRHRRTRVIDGVIRIAMKILLEIVQFLPRLRKTEKLNKGFLALAAISRFESGDCKACYDPFAINNNLARFGWGFAWTGLLVRVQSSIREQICTKVSFSAPSDRYRLLRSVWYRGTRCELSCFGFVAFNFHRLRFQLPSVTTVLIGSRFNLTANH